MTSVLTPPSGASSAPRPRDRQVSEFTALAKTVQDAGLMRRRYGWYWTRFAVLTGLLAGIAAALVLLPDSWWHLVLAVALAVVLGQVMFLGHDAAHRQIFASGRWNDWASLVIANLYAGMSYGWWQHKHSRHHAKPNQVDADPDIRPGVLLFHDVEPVAAPRDHAPTTRGALLAPARRLGRWARARQGWLFFPLLLLEGLNLHVSGVKTIFGRGPVKRRPIEIAFVTLRLGGYLALVFWALPLGIALAFLGVQLGVFGLYMGAVFAPNHKGMPIVPKDAKVDFLRRQVLMSRNVTGSRFVDWFSGGLNHQVEHHLFPSMPRPHLRRARPIVREFCAQRGITYTETTLFGSWARVVRYLNEVGLRAADPFQCPLTLELRSAR